MLQDKSASAAQKAEYWDEYYKQSVKVGVPSQFAAFVAQEAPPNALILEIGCGSGRDSFFFARSGWQVLALDGSRSAIRACDDLKTNLGLDAVRFRRAEVDTFQFEEEIRCAVAGSEGLVFVYARFFIHAITDREEEKMLNVLAQNLRRGDKFAIEFRTSRDATGAKITADHYRRYVNPQDLFARAGRLGFSIEYAVEGYGYAKYKQDDAYVSRSIWVKE